MHPQPISTYFAGYHFRSRSEARYAVLFRALNWPFEFERQGFSLPKGAFLPDFWLPRAACWFEVKAVDPTPAQLDLCQSLADETDRPVYVTNHQPLWQTRCHRLAPNVPARVVELPYLLRCWEFFDQDILRAITEAGSARFEFGEMPLFDRAAA